MKYLENYDNYYVVWHGRKPGIYTDHLTYTKQVVWYPDTKSMVCHSQEDALDLFLQGPRKTPFPSDWPERLKNMITCGFERPIKESYCVNGNILPNKNKQSYFYALDLEDDKLIFEFERIRNGREPVLKFLAIVETLRYAMARSDTRPIYCNSVEAISWALNGKCTAKFRENSKSKVLQRMITEAELFLSEIEVVNPIWFWQEDIWSTIPRRTRKNYDLFLRNDH